MNEALSWSQIGILAVLAGAMFGFYRWINAMQTALVAKIDTGLHDERVERVALERNMNQFRESALRIFVTNDQFREAKNEIIAALDKLDARLIRLDARLASGGGQ